MIFKRMAFLVVSEHQVSYIIKFTCVYMCVSVSVSLYVFVCVSVFVWNRLPNHAHYDDETFTGDSLGLG